MLVLFDAECAFCRRLVGWLAARDAGRRLAFRPLQEAAVLGRFAIDPATAQADVHAVDLRHPEALVSSGADAVGMVVSALTAGERRRRFLRLPAVGRAIGTAYRLLPRGRRRGARCC
ncbi:DUF393 domain-containing protein [Candidatus Poribacteria bacterium]|nr:DUF393 domain-containing protein [Candidatus Poribacteria bacterium]MBT5534922.1 DUF393 domain-containing protein [Candidatus Poribacteria bacterium]MBT7101201.1 DUF393 domain-containing protein [Candidatus Poribacteria bacterium]MBT7805074.1 DUF393 domain-containing protein [Candidatus Poribacteria bacterium]